jgi:general secretion pathway protein D/MSHA biogenesis protein MshL
VLSEATRRRSGNKNLYIIDKPVGMITVTAPRPLLERVDTYFKNLKKELYKQISIEAKIIEVQLTEASSIGINWSEVLKNFSVDGAVVCSNALGRYTRIYCQ